MAALAVDGAGAFMNGAAHATIPCEARPDAQLRFVGPVVRPVTDAASSGADGPLDGAVLSAVRRAQTGISRLGMDLGAIMALVTEHACALTGASGAVLEMAEDEDMVYRAGAGTAAAKIGLRLKKQGSLSGLCIHAGQILRCDDSETDARVDREACRKVGLRSMLVAPLRHSGANVGVLKVVGAQAAAFDTRDMQVLELISGMVAEAMFHAASHEAETLYLRATHDVLTGLPNRALFYDRFRQGLEQARERAAMLGILNLDMGGVDLINDRFGHRAADAAIRQAALRMRRVMRRSDTVARIGEQAFAAVLAGVKSERDVKAQARRVADEMCRPFHFDGAALALDVTVGIALYPQHGHDPAALIDRARCPGG